MEEDAVRPVQRGAAAYATMARAPPAGPSAQAQQRSRTWTGAEAMDAAAEICSSQSIGEGRGRELGVRVCVCVCVCVFQVNIVFQILSHQSVPLNFRQPGRHDQQSATVGDSVERGRGVRRGCALGAGVPRRDAAARTRPATAREPPDADAARRRQRSEAHAAATAATAAQTAAPATTTDATTTTAAAASTTAAQVQPRSAQPVGGISPSAGCHGSGARAATEK